MIRRFSSRRQKLEKTFLEARLKGALAYDRIAGYFSSSLLEIAGETIESMKGPVRVVCNSQLDLWDVKTASGAKQGLWRAWCASRPEDLVDGPGEPKARERFKRLFHLLSDGKLQVRVLPDSAFGLIHGKAGVITLADGSKTSFIGSINESKSAWQV
ncbi:MAG: helicase SNF2, partial [Deltaproteobacteria bacterium]|nr:helicase SNF2 [Deltaproteobacteria bacterium]